MINSYNTIITGGTGELVEKKSRFIGYAQPVASEEEALSFIESIRKKHYDARHNCFAFAVSSENTIYRFSDDGEPQGTAGKPILEIITGKELVDICVVVTRYFGGTLLGTGGLVRAYSEAARLAVASAGIYQMNRMKLLDISCNYNDLGKLQYILNTDGVLIENTEYGTDVILHTAVPATSENALRKKVTEATSARVNIKDAGEAFL